MPNALTLESMSPELVKVVERCSHEPHRRKSRMREIRSSGSGEGPGWVTARPTLQRILVPPPRQHPTRHGNLRSAPQQAGAWRRAAWTRAAGGEMVKPQMCPAAKASRRAVVKGWGADSRLFLSSGTPQTSYIPKPCPWRGQWCDYIWAYEYPNLSTTSR
jgi:hypothetical protein